MKKLIASIALTFLAFLVGCERVETYDQPLTQSGWLSLEELNSLLGELEKKENGKNFWDEGHWVNSVDGRWENGIPEYKISYSKVPENSGYLWHWWFNQDEKSFRKIMHELADKGFRMVYFQSFKRPTEEIKYQGVWHKITPKKVDPDEPK